MSVYLNSTPQEDGNTLTGGAVVVGTAPEYWAVMDRDNDNYLALSSGGQYVGIWDAYGTYLETGDTGFTFRWKVWARGTGTVALTQDGTWDTSTLPATSIGNLVVSAGDWTVYHVTPGTISLTDFLDFEGIRLGFSLSSGAVDISTVQLECVPDGTGTTGWWVNQASYDDTGLTATGKGAGGVASAYEEGSDRQTVWDATYAELIVNNPANETDPTVLGIDNLGALLSGGTLSWVRSEQTGNPLAPLYADMWGGMYKAWVNVSGGFPTLPGDEGVDYIRIPGYVIYDGDRAYSRSAANRENDPSSHVVWDDPYLKYESAVNFAGGEYLLTNVKIWFSVVEEDPHLNTDPIDWSARGTPLKTLTPASSTTEVEAVELPSSGVFAFYAFASVLDEDASTKPVLPETGPGPTDNVALQYGANLIVQSGDDPTPLAADPLTYTKHFNAFSIWDPNATPPGGQLKVWLPDSTWRVVGNEAGSATERLKLQTPDLTWWQEYRTADGAVTTHPLKLYTADGWVVVANMTPD